jgi:opacity protein-like surface antigen
MKDLKRLARVTLLPLMVAGLPAIAEPPLGFYLGGGVSSSNVSVEDNDDYYGDCCYYYGPYDYDEGEEDTGFSVHAGYRFLPYFAAELAYQDAGQPQWDERNLYVRDLDDVFDSLVDLDIQSTQLSALAILPFASVWEAYVRLGVAYWTADADQWLIGGAEGDIYERTVDDEGTTFVFGIGLGASPIPNWHIRLEYQSYSIEEDLLLVNDDATLDSFVLELQYRVPSTY